MFYLAKFKKNFIKNTMENCWVELTVGWKKLSWGENPESDFPGRCAITIILYNNDDAHQSDN